jgi:chaperone required for assembly of F1-ATPase
MTTSDRSIFDAAIAAIDPHEMARKDLRKNLPKRFWKEVTVSPVEGGFSVMLDGRPVRTPTRRAFVLPQAALAEQVAEEWREVGEFLDPAEMPLTRIANSALEGVVDRLEETADDLAKYAGSDFLCYRATDPARLVDRQKEAWNPVLDWAREHQGWQFNLTEGFMHVAQPAETLHAVQAAARAIIDPLELAALHVATTLTGSAVLAFALRERAFSVADIWAAAHVDEDVQMAIWGADDEALARRARRWSEFQAAATILIGKS